MGKKKQAINIQFVFPEGREIKAKEQMTQVLRDSYLRAITKTKKRKQQNCGLDGKNRPTKI